MRIESDRISFTADGHAWWVGPNSDLDSEWDASLFRQLNRACDTCAMIRRVLNGAERNNEPCDDCGRVDGRHTFEIEVLKCPVDSMEECHGCFARNEHGVATTRRVSVVPGMILPIYAATEHWPDATHLSLSEEDRTVWLWQWRNPGFDTTEDYCTLPPDAKPGWWAVQLKEAK